MRLGCSFMDSLCLPCGTNDLLINLDVYTDNGTRLLPIGFLAILVAMGTSCRQIRFDAHVPRVSGCPAHRGTQSGQRRTRESQQLTREMPRIDPPDGLTAGLSRGGNRTAAFYPAKRTACADDGGHRPLQTGQYGHACGDKVLSEIATLFRDHIRDIDRVARWGGEEFVLLFPAPTVTA